MKAITSAITAVTATTLALLGINHQPAPVQAVVWKSDAATEIRSAASVRESQSKRASRYRSLRVLNDKQLIDVLKMAGFRGKDLKEAWAIAKRESNGRPFAYNGNRGTGDHSFGLFQINMIGSLGPERREKFELRSNAELFDPVRNAEIAHYMSRGGKDWSAWHGLNAKARQWLNKYPA